MPYSFVYENDVDFLVQDTTAGGHSNLFQISKCRLQMACTQTGQASQIRYQFRRALYSAHQRVSNIREFRNSCVSVLAELRGVIGHLYSSYTSDWMTSFTDLTEDSEV